MQSPSTPHCSICSLQRTPVCGPPFRSSSPFPFGPSFHSSPESLTKMLQVLLP